MSPLATTAIAALVVTITLLWVAAVAGIWAILRADGRRSEAERERIEHYRGDRGGD